MNKGRDKSIGASVSLGVLIERLGPLNNRWRDGSPAEKVLTLWDMGDVILASVANPSDTLLWEIQERSYITRTLLRYALIVRRAWGRRNSLEKMVRGLGSYTVFREALPFLKGDRERIDDSTQRKVVSLLSDPNTSGAIRFLKRLKTQKIGRRHKKGVSVTAIRDQAVSFKRALARLEAETEDTSVVRPPAQPEVLVALSQMAMAVATGEVVKDLPSGVRGVKDELLALAEPLVVVAQGGRASVAAFRKVVGAERLMQAADLLNSLRAEGALAEWRRRRAAKVLLRSRASTTGVDL